MEKRLIPALVLSGAIATSFGSRETIATEYVDQPATQPPSTIFEPVPQNPNESTAQAEILELRKLRESVRNFTWEDFEDDEKLTAFLDTITQGYNQTANEISFVLDPINSKVEFYRNPNEYNEKFKEIYPENDPDFYSQIFGELDSKTASFQTHINADEISKSVNKSSLHAGYFLMENVWNYWTLNSSLPEYEKGKLLSRTIGEIVGTDDRNDTIIGYNGGSVYTENGTELSGFDSFLSRAITTNYTSEMLNLELDPEHINIELSLSEVEQDILFALRSSGYSAEKLYEFYADSDLDSLLKIIGKSTYIVSDPDEVIKNHNLNKNLVKGFIFAFFADEKYFDINGKENDIQNNNLPFEAPINPKKDNLA